MSARERIRIEIDELEKEKPRNIEAFEAREDAINELLDELRTIAHGRIN